MKNLIKTLEAIGQQNSIQQFDTLNDMIRDGAMSCSEVDEIFAKSADLICFHDSGDDDED